MWKVQALVVHLLLLGSILSIYFQSTVLSGLNRVPDLRDLGLEPPADRLVVFVSDGLRAASVFEDNCSNVPDLQSFFEDFVVVGISKASSPTVTRPGHIAMFAGFVEDPAAALTNFGWNPTNYDTVFNQSRNAFGWMDKVVADIFTQLPNGGKPLHFKTFTKTDISGRLKHDEWVFQEVKKFLTDEANVAPLRKATSVVFFVYLADIDFAGHAFKPTSDRFRETLNNTQRIIRKTHDLFERAFSDERTAYILTSDHGMEDEGKHGGGGKNEMETPFILWGSGASPLAPNAVKNFTANEEGLVLPLHYIDQIQLAPLMSALIGLAPPMNNMALLPRDFLNASAEYKFHALHLNVLQLLNQAKILIRRHEDSIFYNFLPKFDDLTSQKIDDYTDAVKTLLVGGHIGKATVLSQVTGKQAQKCMEYYHSYYHTPLLVSTTLSYLVWFYCLLVQLTRESTQPRSTRQGYLTYPTLIISLAGLLVVPAIVLQNVPYVTAFYLLLPLGLLVVALAERPLEGDSIASPFLHLIGIVLPAGLLVLMAFQNTHIGILYGLITIFGNAKAFYQQSWKTVSWFLLVVLLTVILMVKQNPWLDWLIDPIYDSLRNSYIVYFSIGLSLLRPVFMRHKLSVRVWTINVAALLFAGYGVYQWDNDDDVCMYVYAVCWSYLAYSFLSIPYSDVKNPKGRVELIIFNMLTLHTMVTSCMESIVVQIMVTEFSLNMELYHERKLQKEIEIQEEEGEKIEIIGDSQENNEVVELDSAASSMSPLKHLKESYRYAIIIVLYFYVSFFGTGHWLFNFTFTATISRLFLSSFSLPLSAALILLKIFIPSIIIMCFVYALVSFGRKNARSIMICVFLMNDAMSLYFGFYVDNRGSWKTVRQSLDYLLVTHVFIILLLICSWLAEALVGKTLEDKPANVIQPTSVIANPSTVVGDSRA
ncbi:GPI ethanolamine phosphate transferase 1 [Drosophila bipectinata]|uniref:GPI ethanolamine phosphate transferase 1 n=1 Tax=Drosophila bipectinata TaxID=42026 RepID=UPI001C89D16D|nr:GPI ethanolamine phosphate transferase 1 [Drosophila bipectinata]